jgi:hypothetical protein
MLLTQFVLNLISVKLSQYGNAFRPPTKGRSYWFSSPEAKQHYRIPNVIRQDDL